MEGVLLIGFLDGGLIACWLGGNIMRRGGFGFAGNLIVSVVGAFLGGFFFNALSIAAEGFEGAMVHGTVGAVVLLFIAGLIKRGRACGVALPIDVSDKRHEDRDVNAVKM